MANLFGTGINQIPTNGMLGNLAFQDKAYVSVDKVGIGSTFVDSGTAGQILQVYGGGAYVSGSVGIGTTLPTAKLDVIGDVRITGISTVGFLTATGIWNSGITTEARVVLNGANDTATGGGQIYLNGATGNRIDFNTNGVAGPAFTTRSAGTKLVLYPNIGASQVDFALGIENSTLWYSIDLASSTKQHRWYAGTTQLADLKGTGELVIGSTSLTGTASQRLQVTGGAYVSGSVGIGTTNPTKTLTITTSNGNISIGTVSTSNAIWLNNSTASSDYNILSNSASNFIINRPSGKTILFYQADSTNHATFDTSNNFILNSGNFAVGNFTPSYAVDAGAASLNKAFRIGSIIGGTAGTSYGIIGYNAKPSALNAWTYDVTDVASWIQFLSGGHVFYRGVSGTAAASITPLESGRFDASGNLGINSTSPTSRLDVVGDAKILGVSTFTAANTPAVVIRSGASGSYTALDIGRTGGEFTLGIAAGSGQWATDAVAGDVVIRSNVGKLLFNYLGGNASLAVAGSNVLVGTVSSTGTASQALQVNSGAYVSGNIGIGTTNPTSKLTVQGNALITGVATVTSNFTVNSGTLYGDATNNRVGINTLSPAFTADIAGDARITSTNKMRFGGTAGTTNFYIQYNSTTNSLDFVAG